MQHYPALRTVYVVLSLLLPVASLGHESHTTDSHSHEAPSRSDSMVSVPDSAVPQPPRSDKFVSVPSTRKTDSLQAGKDSLRLLHVRDSLDSVRIYQLRMFERFPTTIDSLNNYRGMNISQLYRADVLGISEALRRAPSMVEIPFSLAGQNNRFLPYGYTAPLVSLGHMRQPFGPVSGANLVGTTDLQDIAFSGPLSLSLSYHPQRVVAPQMGIFWENGVFDGNVLGVRFSRPLSRNLSMGVFSTYRYMAGKDYSHRGIDILETHRWIARTVGIDSTRLVRNGYNPLSQEHVSGIRLLWNDASGSQTHLSYHYQDTRNHLLYDARDTLKWEEVVRYANVANVGIRDFTTGPVLVDASLGWEKGSIRGRALRARRYDDGNANRSGKYQQLSLDLNPRMSLFSDTLGMRLSGQVGWKTLYDASDWDERSGQALLYWTHPWLISGVVGSVTVQGGSAFAQVENSTEVDLVGDVNLYVGRPDDLLSGNLFARRGALPYSAPMDSDDMVAGSPLDIYTAIGGEAFLSTPKAGLMVGVARVSGIDTSSLVHAWPNGILPYQQPRLVVTVAPSTGRWLGWALATRWMFSDEKPFVKSHSSLSYERPIREGRGHVNVDIGLDYWSGRDTVAVGRIEERELWARQILDLNLKAAVQIRSFRLFYKMDNILNGKHAYVPGYSMPGLTFRWGFSWLIPG